MTATAITRTGKHSTAYLQLPGGWFHNNAGWITGERRTLLVDTCATESRSRALLEAARGPDPGTALTAVLTHAHGDHSHGARRVVEQGGVVHAANSAVEEIHEGPHTYPELFEYADWGSIDPPDHITPVTGPTTIELGDTHAEIHPVPTRAHTDGDLVIHHPDDGVLFTGDLLFNGVTPLALHGSIGGWLEALDWLEGFEADTLVPGHGPVSTRDESVLTQQREYLRWLLDSTTEALPDFATLEDLARRGWPEWHDAERHSVNLRVAHAENRDHTPDIADAVAAMLGAAGNRIPLEL
ncbi:MBL fold metallo-hydrolase [Actinopolyspora sp. H202]|uniref:MBL fold metallo-hydrolase n=1 Tax=Actinopolyspora sp. H202 TaxID=1500456 RepID=UPI003EE51092